MVNLISTVLHNQWFHTTDFFSVWQDLCNHMYIVCTSMQPKSTKVCSSCESVFKLPRGFGACLKAGWPRAQASQQNSDHFPPSKLFPFPGLPCSTGWFVIQGFPIYCWNRAMSVTQISPSRNSKTVWMKGDVKPKLRKLLLYLVLSTKKPTNFLRIVRRAWFSIQRITMVWGITTSHSSSNSSLRDRGHVGGWAPEIPPSITESVK